MFLNARDVSLQVVALDLKIDDVAVDFVVGLPAVRIARFLSLSLNLQLHNGFDRLHDFRVHCRILAEPARQPIVHDDVLVVRRSGVVVQRLQFFFANVRRLSAAPDGFNLVAFVWKDDDATGWNPIPEDIDRAAQPSGDGRVAVGDDSLVLVENGNSLHQVDQLALRLNHLDGVRGIAMIRISFVKFTFDSPVCQTPLMHSTN